ncbi:putative acetyltransferase [Panicum miliaceum]|uniref:Acetyltransferase n=1 Tax=Panicum miliaceum TaxID=4540 RepID=A0A3L6SRK8_PANMI|nr:putative acetyltransferase [Panicum miliaceum]
MRMVSRRTVKPPPRPRERIPLTSWDLSMLDGDYIKKGLLFAPPPFSTAHLVDHLHASPADVLVAYYPIAGRFSTDQKRNGKGDGCSIAIDCAGQGAEILHAVADGLAIADVLPPDADVPRVVHSFFPLDGAANYDGHELPLLAVQVTELLDGVFIGFAYNHALSDGTTCWNFLNAWAEIARLRLAPSEAPRALKPPLLQRWSPDGGAAAPVLLPHADLAAWEAKPTVSLLTLADANGMVMASSPRFDVYGCDFGWGKPLAVRSGSANKFDGNVWLFPGREGGGSIEVKVALAPEHMAALEQDNELWDAVSPGVLASINYHI